MDIGPVGMIMSYFRVDVAMAMLSFDAWFPCPMWMRMDMMTIIMMVTMFMDKVMMDMGVCMLFGKEEKDTGCHDRKRSEE